MGSFSNVLVLDLSSYGAALAILNHFCDDQHVKVFEVSPIGHAGLLILLIEDETSAELIKYEIGSYYRASVLSKVLLKNFDLSILKIYLSQNKIEVLSHMLIQEFSFVSEAFRSVQSLIAADISVIDFRLIRTYPANAIVTATASDINKLIDMKTEIKSRSSAVIEKVQPVLKQYFQVVQA